MQSQVLVMTDREHRRCNKKKDNTEKLATKGTQDEDKQNKKNTPLYVNKHK